jgi:hypothetical protein
VSVFTSQTNERKYEVGDVIDIFVRFSDPVQVISSGSGIGAGTGLFLKVYNDDDVYLEKLQTRGVRKSVLYM